MLWCFFLFTAAVAVSQDAFGQGTGPILLDSGCTGTESSLLSCSHIGVGFHHCRGSVDAGVVCPTCKLLKLVPKCAKITCH